MFIPKTVEVFDMLKWWGLTGGFTLVPFIHLLIHLTNVTLTHSVLASVHSLPRGHPEWSSDTQLRCDLLRGAPLIRRMSHPFCDPTDPLGALLDVGQLWFMCWAPSTPSCGPVREKDAGEVSHLNLLPVFLTSHQTLQEDRALSVSHIGCMVFLGPWMLQNSQQDQKY